MCERLKNVTILMNTCDRNYIYRPELQDNQLTLTANLLCVQVVFFSTFKELFGAALAM